MKKEGLIFQSIAFNYFNLNITLKWFINDDLKDVNHSHYRL